VDSDHALIDKESRARRAINVNDLKRKLEAQKIKEKKQTVAIVAAAVSTVGIVSLIISL
tara:strand:+ start:897 stop:1073 length:177 start_codon:yes stop_codon:yes gene_type:complete